MPPKDFLDQFLPLPDKSPNPCDRIFKEEMFSHPDKMKEAKMVDQFVSAVSEHLPNLRLVNTSRLSEKAPTKYPYRCQPDCAVYKAVNDRSVLNSSLVEFFIEFKTTSEKDPFVNIQCAPNDENQVGTEGKSQAAIKDNPFMRTSADGRQVAGQITAYATLVLSTQYRTHTFLALVFKDFSRLIRWDRGGAVVTSPIFHNKEPHLLDFLLRYDCANDDVRGHDMTVGLPTEGEVQLARTIPEFAETNSFLRVAIQSPDRDQGTNHYIITAPYTQLDIPAGRWTRASIAYDINRKMRVFLKDSWRVFLPGVLAEGDVYAKLHQSLVPNIPHCSLSGDVGDHESKTHEFAKKYGNLSNVISPRRHHRLVLDHVGKPLKDFKSSREMVKAVYASLIAHEAAYQAGILHRDLSAGNLLIFDDGALNINGGMLIDWDHCKAVDPQNELTTARPHTRTGTWQFMAADLIENSSIRQTFVHDLESAFWVMLWVTISHLPSSWEASRRSSFLDNIMNPRVCGNSGGPGKAAMLRNPLGRLKLGFHQHLATLLESLRMVLASRYVEKAPISVDPIILDEFGTPEKKPSLDEKLMAKLNNHKFILELFESALGKDGWPEDDAAEQLEILVSNDIQIIRHSSSKRSRDAAEENCSEPAVKRTTL
ncbi:hypothetical protein F5148DRAFT_1288603 [Russula earlei]|uniref:Uncharacterized protein n=1 Tax=Russula earlei TaxID=71964 RepID=A0ACC0TZC4_9AGAM|nr:hypothetical protein F5148DRAFT_1288603 [Russula earlei]